MVDESGPELVRGLAEKREGPCVSIYVAMPKGRGAHEWQVRLAQLLAMAGRELRAEGMELSRVTELLAPAHRLLGRPGMPGDGRTLALFASPGFFSLTRGAFGGTEKAVVGRRFHVRPLLSSLATPERFYVLALSLNHVRLVEATPHGIHRLPLGEVEAGFVAAMGYSEFYSDVQLHSAGGAGGGAARRPAIVHGHGDSDEERLDEDLRHWFRRVAKAVAARTVDRHALRVLATSSEHISRFLAASRDPMLLPHAVVGNPDRLSDAALVARARPLVKTALAWRRQEALSRWRELLSSDRATGDVGTTLRHARQGRVQTLFLPADTDLWGSYDEATGNLEVHIERRPDDEELLERAAIETILGGGDVCEIGDGGALDGAPLASLLRH